MRAVDHYGSAYNQEFHTPIRPGSTKSSGGNLVDKVRQQISQGSGGLGGFEQSMKKLGSKGGESVNREELLLAFSRNNATLNLDEVRDFFSIV